MAACIAEGRLAAGASKLTKSGPSGPSSSSYFLFRGPKNGAKNRPQKRGQKPAPKTGPQYFRKKERLPKWRPCFWDQGVCSGTFHSFSWQWAWQSLIQVSHYIYYIYIYIITQNRLVVLHATHQSSSRAVWFQDANPTARSIRPMIPKNLGWAPGGPGASARKRVKHIEHWNYGYGNHPLGMMRNSNGFKFQLTNVCTDWGISVPDIRGSGNLAWASLGNIWLCHPRSNIQIYSSAEGHAQHNSAEDVGKGLVNSYDALHVNPPTS